MQVNILLEDWGMGKLRYNPAQWDPDFPGSVEIQVT